MNDRFKFRAWEKDQKIMKECTQITLDKDQKGSMCDVKGKVTAHLVYQPHYILMQCTGLKDKNGKLIYEGDIVKFKTELFGTPKQIVWDECHYILQDTFIILCDMEIKQFGLEIIGNIYENPELLEEV